MKQTLFNLVAWLIFIVSIILSIGLLVGACAGFIFLPQADLKKLFLLAIVLVLLAVASFIIGLGIFEFIRKELIVEKEVEEIEEKMHDSSQISK